MAWTTPRTWVAGESPSASTLNTHIRDNLKEIANAWTAFTPTWTGTTDPAIGNGTIDAAYRLIGKAADFRIRITMGSTTTYGTGEWLLSLPTPATTSTNGPLFMGVARDVSATASYLIVGELSGSSNLRMRVTGGAGGILASMTSAAPFAWASTDVLHLSGSYEAA